MGELSWWGFVRIRFKILLCSYFHCFQAGGQTRGQKRRPTAINRSPSCLLLNMSSQDGLSYTLVWVICWANSLADPGWGGGGKRGPCSPWQIALTLFYIFYLFLGAFMPPPSPPPQKVIILSFFSLFLLGGGGVCLSPQNDSAPPPPKFMDPPLKLSKHSKKKKKMIFQTYPPPSSSSQGFFAWIWKRWFYMQVFRFEYYHYQTWQQIPNRPIIGEF